MTGQSDQVDEQTSRKKSIVRLVVDEILEPFSPILLQLLWVVQPVAVMIDRQEGLQNLINQLDENMTLDSQETIDEY